MTTTPQTAGWQLEDSSAEAYERHLVPIMMRCWAEHLVALAAPRPGERVLDVACGTGIVARTASSAVGAHGRVVGLDLNEGMLAVARRVASALRPPIEWQQGDATALPFDDASFDMVFCQQGLQFVPDPSAAVREMRRMLAPGGRAAVLACRPIAHSPAYVTLSEVLERHLGPEAGAMMRSLFPSWTSGTLDALFAGAGFPNALVRIDVDPVRYASAEEFLRQETSSAPFPKPVQALILEQRQSLVRDLESGLEDRRDGQGLVLPIETYLVLGRRVA